MESRESVLKHPKFQEIFAEFTDALGMNEEKQFDHWDTFKAGKYAKYQAELVKRAEAKAKKEAEREI